MKILSYLFVGLFALVFLTACNNGEGEGGSCSIEGYVFQVRYPSDNLSFKTDTIPFADEDVHITYSGAEDYSRSDDRKKIAYDGYYRFDYLRKGDYKIYAYSEKYDDTLVEEIKTVKVNSSMNKADTIFVHVGKAYGSAIIKGKVTVDYYSDNTPLRITEEDGTIIQHFPAVETRVYLKNPGEPASINDVRVSDTGEFAFQKVAPGRTYEVYVVGDVRTGDDYKNVIMPKTQTITIPTNGEHKIHELAEEFNIVVNI